MAADNDRRASDTENPKLKKTFLELASWYRELAGRIDHPELRSEELLAPLPSRGAPLH
jgi:hypothetical protein